LNRAGTLEKNRVNFHYQHKHQYWLAFPSTSASKCPPIKEFVNLFIYAYLSNLKFSFLINRDDRQALTPPHGETHTLVGASHTLTTTLPRLRPVST
jgi:hypothetical protein